MPSRIDPVRPGEASSPAVDERLAALEDVYGDGAFYGALANQPTVFERVVDLFEAFPQTDIDPALLELVRLKVADVHRCAYCGTVRVQDVREDVAPKEAAVLGEIDESALTDREAAAVRLAEAMSRDAHAVDDALFAALLDVFSEPELIELLTFTSVEVGFDRFCIALQLDTTEDSPYPTELQYPREASRPRD